MEMRVLGESCGMGMDYGVWNLGLRLGFTMLVEEMMHAPV